MSYLDVYFSRINHLGGSTAERIRNSGIRSFEKWLAESPHTVRNLSVERGIYFDGIILTSKDKEYEKIMFLEVANDIPLLIGDILNWTLDDGTIEKWLLIQEEKKVNGTFKSFWIIRCNYLMKWIDSEGHLNQSWGYFVSSLDSKIKGNFRTWHSIITPQPNKYAELLLPRFPIDRATNFIVEDESWIVVEYDHTSVPGVVYLSLTENKINTIYDDTENNIADLDKLARYEFKMLPLTQVFHLGDHIKPVYSLSKNGQVCGPEYCEDNIEFLSNNKQIVNNVGGILVAVGKGETTIVARLKQHPEIQQEIQVIVGEVIDETPFSAYLEGADKIRLDRTEVYRLMTPIKHFNGINNFLIYTTTVVENNSDDNYIYFEHPKLDKRFLQISPSNGVEKNILAEVTSHEINASATDEPSTLYAVVRANEKNKLGYVVLECIYTYNNTQYSVYKPIEIIPLW